MPPPALLLPALSLEFNFLVLPRRCLAQPASVLHRDDLLAAHVHVCCGKHRSTLILTNKVIVCFAASQRCPLAVASCIWRDGNHLGRRGEQNIVL